MLTAVFLSIAAIPNCPVPLQPIAISAAPLKGEALDGQADTNSSTQYRVGKFMYQGYGIVASSSDPRYGDLVLDQQIGLKHRCGNSVAGPSWWNVRKPNLLIKIESTAASAKPLPGSVAAEERKAQPVLTGYIAGATWPANAGGDRFFLGLMHPIDHSTETLIVAFRDDPQPTPALIMARIPMVIETLSVTPDIHGTDNFLILTSLQKGIITRFALCLDRDTASMAYSRLTKISSNGK